MSPFEVLAMIPFLPEVLLRILAVMDRLAHAAQEAKTNSEVAKNPHAPADLREAVERNRASIRDTTIECLSICADFATEASLDGTAVTCAQLSRRVQDDSLDGPELQRRVAELREFFVTELSQHRFFQLLRSHHKYLGSRLFGEEVWNRFPAARDDITEAGLCLAVLRGTASVFHLMRVMEEGLKAIAAPLGIPYAPSWESYLRQMDKKINEPHSTKPPDWRRLQPLFIELLGDLQSVKIAWRNPTMHIVRHYTPEEAEEIFAAVRRFMSRLAQELSEPINSPSGSGHP